MVEVEIIEIVKKYLASLSRVGINAVKGVLFGSFARGDANEWSDIDLIVIAPEFNEEKTLALVENLWLATKYADSRIEPIPCGVKEWEEDEDRPIIDIARREGIIISI